jgi:hypothetical protein
VGATPAGAVPGGTPPGGTVPDGAALTPDPLGGGVPAGAVAPAPDFVPAGGVPDDFEPASGSDV